MGMDIQNETDNIMNSPIGGALTQGAIGIGLGAIQNSQNANNSQAAMELSHQYQTRMNNQLHGLQLDLFNKTGFGGQMKQLKEAGLNAGLMYKQGGSSGQTGISNSSTQAQQVQSSTLEGIDIASGVRLNEALAKQAEAQATKASVEADKISGVDTEEAQTRIGNIKANTVNTELQTKIGEYEKTIKAVDAELASTEGYNWERLESLVQQNNKTAAEAASALIKSEKDQATKADEIAIIRESAISVMLENDLKRAGIEKTHAEIDKISAEIANMLKQRELEGKDLDRRETEMYINAVLGGLGIVAGSVGAGRIAEAMKKTEVTKTFKTDHKGRETQTTTEKSRR